MTGRWRVLVALGLTAVVVMALQPPLPPEPAPSQPLRALRLAVEPSAASQMYGTPASGLPWHSGFWTGGEMSAARIRAAGRWRGRDMDFVTTYPLYRTWTELANSEWHIATFDGFAGHLAYGLPLLPANRRGQWGDITSGSHDAVFRTIARQLARHGRGDTAIRVGLEANGDWFPWGVTRTTAPTFRGAFRRVVRVMRAEAPDLTFWLDVSAGFGLPGQQSRMDAFTLLYPGDAYVDGIAMDHYDFYQIQASTDAEWRKAIAPASGPGLADAARFARSKNIGLAVPEWGVHGTRGVGDNPFFIRKMNEFFRANRDVLVFENYFNEPATYISSALWGSTRNPRSAQAYQLLW